MKVTLVDGRTLLKWLEVANGLTLANIGDEAGSLAELLVEQVIYVYLSREQVMKRWISEGSM